MCWLVYMLIFQTSVGFFGDNDISGRWEIIQQLRAKRRRHLIHVKVPPIQTVRQNSQRWPSGVRSLILDLLEQLRPDLLVTQRNCPTRDLEQQLLWVKHRLNPAVSLKKYSESDKANLFIFFFQMWTFHGSALGGKKDNAHVQNLGSA